MMDNLLDLVSNDGLPVAEVKPWAEDKYNLIHYYISQFATSMKQKWDARIYIDLFAGCGVSKIKGTEKFLLGSPLIAMNIKYPFDKYIFCDIESEYLNVLEKRQKKYLSHLSTEFILGDVNTKTNSILNCIPRPSKNYKVLTFCLIDPYKLKNFQFITISDLSKIYVDFLLLIPTNMDLKRNWLNYLQPNNSTIDLFLGESNWREDWKKNFKEGVKFSYFFVKKFNKQMEELNYRVPKSDYIVQIRNKRRNVPLYHLTFYSRHPLGMQFWENAVNRSTNQLNFLHNGYKHGK